MSIILMTLEECEESRQKLIKCIANARLKLFEQDQEILGLKKEHDKMRKTIGELRARISILESQQSGECS